MEESRTVLKSISKTKHTYFYQEENDENKALNITEKQYQEHHQEQQQQQEYRQVNRKLYNNKRQTIRQDPRNVSALKSRRDQLAAETVAAGEGEEQTIDPAASEETKPEKREKTEEEIKQEREDKENDVKKYEESIFYSPYYYDDEYEYRHVVLPKQLLKWIPNTTELLPEEDWRSLGVKQSKGWVHYMVYAPEPHILLFKREINYIQKYGNEDRKVAKSKDIKETA